MVSHVRGDALREHHRAGDEQDPQRGIRHQVDPRERDGELAETEQMTRDRDDGRGHDQREVGRVHDGQACPEVCDERRPGALAGPGASGTRLTSLDGGHTKRIGNLPLTGYRRVSDAAVGRSAPACRCLSYAGPCTRACCIAYRMSCALELMPIFSRIRVRYVLTVLTLRSSRVGDFGDRVPRRQQHEHLVLAWRQQLVRRLGSGAGNCHMVGQLPGHGLAEIAPPLEHAANRLEQFLRSAVLGQVGRDADPERAHDELPLAVHAQHDDRHAGTQRLQLRYQLQAVAIFERDVEHEYGPVRLPHLVAQLCAGAGLAHGRAGKRIGDDAA